MAGRRTVQRADAVRTAAATAAIDAPAAARTERLRRRSANELAGPRRIETSDEDELRVPIVEERLAVEKRPVAAGELRLHKRVEQEEARATQPVMREDVAVERIPVNRVVESPDAAPKMRIEGDYLVVPLLAEELVVQKRLVVKEELRIHKQQLVENQEVRELLRREHVVVEDATVRGVHVLEPKGTKGGMAKPAAPRATLPRRRAG
jgi:uncharacterized protein (TIGR02271 family)